MILAVFVPSCAAAAAAAIAAVPKPNDATHEEDGTQKVSPDVDGLVVKLKQRTETVPPREVHAVTTE